MNAQRFATQDQIVHQVKNALPIHDLMAWMIASFPKANRDQIFTGLKWIYAADFHIAPASSKSMAYEIGEQTVTACPQRVEEK